MCLEENELNLRDGGGIIIDGTDVSFEVRDLILLEDVGVVCEGGILWRRLEIGGKLTKRRRRRKKPSKSSSCPLSSP